VKKATKPIESIDSPGADYSPPDLKVIRGGATTEIDESCHRQRGPSPREAFVKRARQRVDTGYYERPEIKRRLVDALWEEFYSR
jgi:hypothetical protein